MLWLVPLACAAVGLVVLVALAARLRHELEPMVVLIDRFGREHQVALGRVRDETAAAHRRLSGD